MPHNMTVTIEDPLWEQMKKHSDVRWSIVMKKAINEKLDAARALEILSKKSKLSESEIKEFSIRLGKSINSKK